MKVTQEYIYSKLLDIFLVTLKIFISNFIEYDQNYGLIYAETFIKIFFMVKWMSNF